MPELENGLPPLTKEEAAPWLAAILDGEGSVSVGPTSQMVRFANSSPFILNQVAYCLDLFGVTYAHYVSCGVCTIRVTGRDNFARINEACGGYIVTHKRERLSLLTHASEKVRQACEDGCTCAKHVKRYGPRPAERKHDWARARELHEAGMSVAALSRLFRTGRSHVYTMIAEGAQ